MGLKKYNSLFCLLVIVTFLFQASCGNFLANNKQKKINDLAIKNGWESILFKTKAFQIQGFLKNNNIDSKFLVIYIEGDGNAWKNKRQIATDPTPKKPTALYLALQDTYPNILYLSRPCQYNQLGFCHPKYWSSHRYSEVVITMMDDAINLAKKKMAVDNIGIIGFSGGGSVAVLLSARRKDIKWLMTIAANLDHLMWTQHHSVSPLFGSLNALDYAKKIQHIPQIHFVGEEDTIVPVSVVKSFQNKMDINNHSIIFSVEEFDHNCCWSSQWGNLLEKHLTEIIKN